MPADVFHVAGRAPAMGTQPELRLRGRLRAAMHLACHLLAQIRRWTALTPAHAKRGSEGERCVGADSPRVSALGGFGGMDRGGDRWRATAIARSSEGQ